MLDRTRQFRASFERRANIPSVATAQGLACDWLVRRIHLHNSAFGDTSCSVWGMLCPRVHDYMLHCSCYSGLYARSVVRALRLAFCPNYSNAMFDNGSETKIM